MAKLKPARRKWIPMQMPAKPQPITRTSKWGSDVAVCEDCAQSPAWSGIGGLNPPLCQRRRAKELGGQRERLPAFRDHAMQERPQVRDYRPYRKLNAHP